MNFKTPIRKNFLASGFGFSVQLCNQILIVPFFLTLWGVEEYGDWILLTAIANIFGMTDAGLNSVTQNRFSIDYAQKKYETCRSLLTNNLLLIFFVGILSLLGCITYLFFWNIKTGLGLHTVSEAIAQGVFLLMTLSVFIKMIGTVLDSIYRATSQAYKAILIGQINIILNLIAIISGIVIFHSMIYIAYMFVISDICIVLYKFIKIQSLFPYTPKWKYHDTKLFKELLFPSLAFMGYPISNIMIYQGFTILVNKFLGVEAMLGYNTIRTLTSFVRKIINIIQSSIWPEYSIAYGKNDINRMRNLHRKAFSIAFPLTIIITIFIMIFGKTIYEIWTNNKIAFDYSLAFSFCFLTIIRNLWDTSNVVMIATNKHVQFCSYLFSSSILALVLSITLIQFYKDIEVFVYSQLALDLLLCYHVIKRAMILTNDTASSFFYSPISLAKQQINKIILHKDKKLHLLL